MTLPDLSAPPPTNTSLSRGDQKTVIAGYHWFSDWGRDTMIALPGLTLLTGKHDIARSILRTFARNVDQGMLPNRFPDAGETPEYNTVDATLWFFEAARAYLAYSGDFDFVRNELYPGADGHHCLARSRHPVRNQSGSQRPAGFRRARSPADLDGRQGGRLGCDTTPRKAGGNPGALVQRAVHHG